VHCPEEPVGLVELGNIGVALTAAVQHPEVDDDDGEPGRDEVGHQVQEVFQRGLELGAPEPTDKTMPIIPMSTTAGTRLSGMSQVMPDSAPL